MVVTSLKTRIGLIVAMVLGSVIALIPRETTLREQGADGVMHDTTFRQLPLKRGLDLQGGMHLGLELDQSKRVSADPGRDIDLALTVLRKRIDEFGVTEPLVQKQGDDRIVVELAGISDPGRAKQVVQKSAFLEFRITDRSQAFDKALPSMDRTLLRLGVRAGPGAVEATPNAVTQLLQGDSTKRDSAKADSTPVVGGALSTLIQSASTAGYSVTPGEYLVEEGAVTRVDSLLNLPGIKSLFPRRYEWRWGSAPISVGAKCSKTALS